MHSLGYFLQLSIEDITSLHYSLLLKLGLLPVLFHAFKLGLLPHCKLF